MAHTSKLCSRVKCTDLHPYHMSNGLISNSIRSPRERGLLIDEDQARELRLSLDPRFREVRDRQISQNDFDTIFQAGRKDGLREGLAAGSAVGSAAGYHVGEQTARESAARLF